MSALSNVSFTPSVVRNTSGSRASDCEVVIIGAGPCGLSAAHLKSKGMAVRVFGKAMDFWANKMPAGMLLRSPRIASTISDAANKFRLEAYEKLTSTPPVWPVALTTRTLGPLSYFVAVTEFASHALAANIVSDRKAR